MRDLREFINEVLDVDARQADVDSALGRIRKNLLEFSELNGEQRAYRDWIKRLMLFDDQLAEDLQQAYMWTKKL